MKLPPVTVKVPLAPIAPPATRGLVARERAVRDRERPLDAVDRAAVCCAVLSLKVLPLMVPLP